MVKKEYPGQYRIGDLVIIRETRRRWRVWWMPKLDRYRTHHGVPGDGFHTLRDAKASALEEIAVMQKYKDDDN